MATSGSWNFSLTAAQLIQAAWEDAGIIVVGGTITAADLAMALRRLNMIVKQWQGNSDMAPGLKVWTRQRIALFLEEGENRYTVGPSGDHATASYVSTTLGAAKNASATSLTVASTTGMTASDAIGIVLTDGSLGWTTISSVDSATGLTLAANSLGAASSGAVVFTYTSKAQRFVEWESVLLRDNSDPSQPIDLPLRVYDTVQEYESLNQKLASGDPTAVLIEPERLNTIVTLDYAAANVYKLLRITAVYPAEDYDDATGADDIAFPQEYYLALKWELQKQISPAKGRPWTKDMDDNYKTAIARAFGLNPQESDDYFQPGRE